MVKVTGSWMNKQGYIMIRLSNNKCIPLHVLIWQNIHKKKVPLNHEIHHKDYDIYRNCASNLECIKSDDNIRRRKYE